MTLPLFAALLVQTQGGSPLPPSASPATVPSAVRDWAGFKYLPTGGRSIPDAFPAPADWSNVKTAPAVDAAVWRTKVVILDRVDRVHDRGGDLVWPGLHGLYPKDVDRVKRAVAQFQALVPQLTNGAVRAEVDVMEEPEILTIQGGDLNGVVAGYLNSRINGGKYEAEDNVFRGPYQSIFVVHPAGGENPDPFVVQGAVVHCVGVPDVPGQEVDGYLARAMAERWEQQVARRAQLAGVPQVPATVDPAAKLGWPTILAGWDDTTEARLAAVAAAPPAPAAPLAWTALAPRGAETAVVLGKDGDRGSILTVQESGSYRAGGLSLPMPEGKPLDVAATPTFAFWAKSDAKDPIVLQFDGKVVRLGTDVPFAYDSAWHRVKVDLRPLTKVERILIAPDASAKGLARLTVGPISASFADFELTNDAPDAKPTPEAPSATATGPEARAAWAATAPPGEDRRRLMKDPVRAVAANALESAVVRPDPADEPQLIESGLYNFEQTIFTPALRALGKIDTPTAKEAMARAARSAASDKARGVAAMVLAESGDPKYVAEFFGLNQARSRTARIYAIRALAKLPGTQASMLRMAFLPQNDNEIKLEATLTADPNDDEQARKLLWSAVNEPSDAVRLESLRRLSTSTIKEFQDESFRGVRDDSVGVRVGLLEAWTAAPRPEYAPSIRLALTDSSPRVRAAAVAALAACVETLEAKDLLPDDPDPRVQAAALKAAKAKGIALPAEALERMKKSPDPAVRAAVEA